jgi:adenylate cyclase
MTNEGFKRKLTAILSADAVGYATLANAHMLDVWFGFSEFREESMRMAAEAAQKALALDTSDPRVYHTLTNLYIMQRQYENEIASAESGLKLSSSSAQAHNSMGLALSFAGEDSKAIPFIEQAIRLDPYPSSVTFRTLGSSYRAVGRYEEAIIELNCKLQHCTIRLSKLSILVLFIRGIQTPFFNFGN